MQHITQTPTDVITHASGVRAWLPQYPRTPMEIAQGNAWTLGDSSREASRAATGT